MIRDELAAAGEQVRKRPPATRCPKHVRLLDALPRQLAPLATQLIAQPRERLLFLQQLPTGRQPILRGNDAVGGHGYGPRCLEFTFVAPAAWRQACDAARPQAARRCEPGSPPGCRTAPASTCCSGSSTPRPHKGAR